MTLASRWWLPVAAVLVAAVPLEAQPPQARPTERPRIIIGASGGAQPNKDTFGTSSRFTLFAEEGDFEADYEVGGGTVRDGGGSVFLWRNIAAGVSVSRVSSTDTAGLDARLPHPFFFDQPRTLSGTAGGLLREEVVTHLHGAYIVPIEDWVMLSVFGGPSFFNVKQDLVWQTRHREVAFPFDAVAFEGANIGRSTATKVGVHAGIDASFFVLPKLGLGESEWLRRIGFGVLIRYSRAELDVTSLEIRDERGTRTVAFEGPALQLGGMHAAAGVRVRF